MDEDTVLPCSTLTFRFICVFNFRFLKTPANLSTHTYFNLLRKQRSPAIPPNGHQVFVKMQAELLWVNLEQKFDPVEEEEDDLINKEFDLLTC
ncbi:hypothetical protein LXL04_028981 [Taraxacum kok-saghyz]